MMQQRHCLVLQGTDDWLQQQAEGLFQQCSQEQRLWLAHHADPARQIMAAKQSFQFLGREFALVIFDGRDTFPTDAFAAIIGTLMAGGTLVLMLDEAAPSTCWQQRLWRIAHTYPLQWLHPNEPLPLLPAIEAKNSSLIPTTEQQSAIEAVINVATGHRRRPLVISADRGRGKTVLLAMAAVRLLKMGKQQVLVTAPTPAQVETLFTTAAELLPDAQCHDSQLHWQQAKIGFIAPDVLIEQQPQADIVLVDEAAAIPTPMLEKMLRYYSRIVFSSTVHGYEGTGRGFSLRFHKLLDAVTPQWRAIQLIKPIRWADNDWLEQFSFDALLLNAEPATDDSVHRVANQSLQYEWIDKNTLLTNDKLLRQIFGLMVLAHYRTRPSDLQMLLDRDDIRVLVLRRGDIILATLWLVTEPAIETALAEKIFNGKRRLKGQLLPQSLLVYAGLASAGEYRYQRIIRIAVHPGLQRNGLGSELLTGLISEIEHQNDIVGTSFALDDRLLSFWLKNGFVPVRVGTHADKMSAARSVLMLKALNEAGKELLAKAKNTFSRQWPLLLSRQYQTLPAEQVILLSIALYQSEPVADTVKEVSAFAYSQRPYEASEAELINWLSTRLSSPIFVGLAALHQHILIKKLMQNQTITKIANQLGLTGKAQVMATLREAVAAYLSAETK